MSKKSGHEGKTANDVSCWDCAEDAGQRLKEMFVELIQKNRIELGQSPALRTVFLKAHGIVHGKFRPLDNLPQELKVGTFAHGKLDCWVRFSSDAQPTDPDLHSTLGIGIKLFGVPGPKLLGEGDTADFILQNHDVFFVDDAKEFCEFTTAGVIDQNYPKYLKEHPKTRRILKEMKKPEASCLTANYWGLLPSKLGTKSDGEPQYVKYKLEPCGQPAGKPFDDNNYLGLDLASRLRNGHAHFKFMVQLRTDPESMPLDKATERWDSPWIHVADLDLPKQNINHLGQAAYGENLAFNIWRTPPEQEPQGSIAAVRKLVYEASADQRRLANGVSLTEPKKPAPAHSPKPAKDKCIVSAAIYPPIGVCRVGNSPDEYYLGPEVPDPLPLPPGSYRDSQGRLKREAARFRVYGLNALGEAVKELTLDDAEIEWHVKLANQKASWYEFQLALDIPEAADAPPSLLRNASVKNRDELTIAPDSRKVAGRDKSGSDYAFDDGEFMKKRVYLGELRTDAAGRLIVLGGRGHSASHDGSKAITFANNEGWHDDTSDGPVKAKVTYKGVKLKVQQAWVITAPPNYGPQQKSVRTMWDLMRDVAVSNGLLPRPKRPSFRKDILPIFQRMHDLQWVNQGFAAAFGFEGPFDLTTPTWIARLGSSSPAHLEMRRILANQFRQATVDSWSPVPWPWLYGDAMSVPAAHTPRQNCALSDLQMWFLDQWVLGNFDADCDSKKEPQRKLEDVAVERQPDTLTRAAMEFCLADAFHPGCEMTWPMRNAGMYESAFRLKHRHHKDKENSYGAQLNQDVLSLPMGPLTGGQSPGSITRWMAVPWQTDTASCRSGYDSSYDPYVPTFWPARVPNEVMSKEAYDIVMNEELELSERKQAFANRASWIEPLGLQKGYTHQINHMVHHFDEMGVVEAKPGPKGSVDFPTEMQVSDQVIKHSWDAVNVANDGDKDHDLDQHQLGSLGRGPGDDSHGDTGKRINDDLNGIEKVRRFPNGLRRSRQS